MGYENRPIHNPVQVVGDIMESRCAGQVRGVNPRQAADEWWQLGLRIDQTVKAIRYLVILNSNGGDFYNFIPAITDAGRLDIHKHQRPV